MVARIEIVGGGDSILLRDNAENYLRSDSGSGWGKAPVANFRTEGAAPGWKYRGSRAVGRTLVLPVVVFGDSPSVINDRVRRLVRLAKGEFQLRFTTEQDDVFTIPAVYESGLEGVYTVGDEWAEFRSLTVSCPDPFWTSQDVENVGWVYSSGLPLSRVRLGCLRGLSIRLRFR